MEAARTRKGSAMMVMHALNPQAGRSTNKQHDAKTHVPTRKGSAIMVMLQCMHSIHRQAAKQAARQISVIAQRKGKQHPSTRNGSAMIVMLQRGSFFTSAVCGDMVENAKMGRPCACVTKEKKKERTRLGRGLRGPAGRAGAHRQQIGGAAGWMEAPPAGSRRVPTTCGGCCLMFATHWNILPALAQTRRRAQCSTTAHLVIGGILDHAAAGVALQLAPRLGSQHAKPGQLQAGTFETGRGGHVKASGARPVPGGHAHHAWAVAGKGWWWRP